ncbi:MAG: radical SAM protein [Treponema sp.]|nr:radical SAM protein [Treponema sp.]
MAQKFSDIEQNHPCFASGKATTGRIHLPVCPGCNIACRFCERSLNATENRPGVTQKVLTPDQTVPLIRKALEISPEIRVAGIAGPGDTLASDNALKTFRLIKKEFPHLIKCMSTNGLLLSEKADQIISAGVDTLTVTVNAVDPAIEAQLNDYIIYHGKKIEGIEGARILIKNQLEGIQKIAQAGIAVKVNTVLVPRINGNHIADIAQKVSEAGAKKYNIIPLIPTAKLKDENAPTCQEIHEARRVASQYIQLFLHCNHCRADAVGVPGKTEVSNSLYASFGFSSVKENFSHG